MKRLIAMICLAGATLLCVQSGNIPLRGSLAGGLVKNPLQTPLVEVYQDTGSIELSFLCNLGKLTITVTDQYNEEVYGQSIDTSAVGNLIIDTNGWESGEYTLLIMDGQGGYLEGCFLID